MSHASRTLWRRLTAAWRAADLGPALPAASCRGRAPLFDLDLPGEKPAGRNTRHRLAARVCARCPELPTCHALLDALPIAVSITGVYAGCLLDGRRPPQPIPLTPDIPDEPAP